MDLLDHRLKLQTLTFAQHSLTVECIADLDETIDRLFEELSRTGNAALLEELCPYFGVIWPSAKALAETIAELYPQVVARSKRSAISVLEIGCGLALPSLLAERLGATVTATDFHPEVETFLSRNLVHNETRNLCYRRMDWQKASEAVSLGQYNWVIGSDILYEKHHPAIVAAVLGLTVTQGGQALIADPGRPYLQSFVDAMTATGFTHRSHFKTVIEPSGSKEIFLLSFQRGLRLE